MLTAVGTALILSLGWLLTAAAAQDVIVSRAPEDETLITRRGTILEWRGAEVVMESTGGARRIPNARVVEYQTTWQSSYETARRLMDQRQLLEAVPVLARALDDEPRAWARHVIRADWIRCLSLAGQDPLAAQQFVELIAEDSQTRYMSVIPLSWGTVTHDPNFLNQAQRWLAASHPAVSLLGASWLLSSPHRPQALQVLEDLSRDIDPQIAHLASAQLWRAQVTTADARQLNRWLAQIDRMPTTIRPGPRQIAAEALLRQGQAEDALLELMKTIILSKEHYRLCLTALEQSETILTNQGNVRGSEGLRREIVRDFPGTSAAHSAQLRLNQGQ